MNKLNTFVLGIYQVALIIRDTLEYAVIRESYSLEAYEQRKKALEMLLEENAPLQTFIKNNGEKAQEILVNIQRFQENIYGEQSTIVSKTSNGLKVDHNQHVQIYEQVIGIYQTLLDILFGYMNYAKENGLADDEVIELFKLDERVFRLYAHIALVHDLMRNFTEFNKIVRENNGKTDPLSNFVVEDMKKLNGFVMFQKQHNRIIDVEYKEITDEVYAFIENMEGKRALPEGKSFPDIHRELSDKLIEELSKTEPKWKEQFQQITRRMVGNQKSNLA